jgi:hypothetical protein
MPEPGASLHIASVDYYCTFSPLVGQSGKVTFSCPDPVHFLFSFETGQVQVAPGVVQVTWDYSWFSQAAVEADISQALSQIVAALAALLSLSLAQVDAAVLVRRVWTIAPNVQGAGAGSGLVTSIDVMQYPPLVSGADSMRGASAGRVAVVAGTESGYAAEGASHAP